MKQRLKRSLCKALRDILIIVALISVIFGGAALWHEKWQADGSGYELPVQPAPD